MNWQQASVITYLPFILIHNKYVFYSVSPGRCIQVFKSLSLDDNFCQQMQIITMNNVVAINNGADSGLKLSDNKPLPEYVLTQIYGDKWHF